LPKVNALASGGDTWIERQRSLPMYYIALLVAVLSFMAVVASLDPARRRQSRIARRQRD
jgi:hypothetical protein